MRRRTDPAEVLCFFLCSIISILPVVIPFLSVISVSSHAQAAAPITPSGLNTQVNLSQVPPLGKTQYDITGGTRPGGGANLFHSFGNFNVPNNNIANFLNDSGQATSNILSRVTGGNISNIFGTIQTTGFQNANLFLMNPAGFLFGPNATLNVGGIVAFTTADYLRLADGVRFNAVPDVAADALLSAAQVAAFGFLGPNAASIAIQGGTLQVPDGQTLSFIGGPRVFTADTGVTVPSGVTMTAGHLSAPNGLIYMETVTSPGEIPLPTLSGNPLGTPVSFPGSESAVIRIQSGELVMKGASLLTATTGPTSGAPIGIDVEVAGLFTMQNVSTLSSSTTGEGQGGAINVSASTLAMDASSIVSATSGQGTGGNISVRVAGLDLSNGAQIVTRTDGPGLGGGLDIVASDHVTVAGIDPTGTVPGVLSIFGSVPSGLLTVTTSTGDGGDVTVRAPQMNVTDGGHIGSFGSGDGAGGNLTLNVGTLSVTGGGQVWSSSGLDFTTFAGGGGSSGHITVNATDEIVVSGGDPFLFGPSQISTNAFGTGDGGSINLIAPTGKVRLEDGGAVSSLSQISNTGPITVQTDTLSISGFLDQFGFPLTGGIVTSSSNPVGQGGGISVAASSVNVAQGSISNTGGPVSLIVDTLNVTGGGQVSALGAGAISITAADSVTVSGQFLGLPSRIQSQTRGDATNGGISITAVKNVSVTDGGRINLEIGDQPGGQIAIDAESITIASGGKIRMDVGNGGGGQVQLTAKTISMDQGIIQTQSITETSGGDVTLRADNLTMSGSFINSATEGSASVSTRSGNITINVTEALSIGGRFNGSSTDGPRPAGIYATAGPAGGDAGQVSIKAGMVNITGGARIDTSTPSTGQGGSVSLKADQSVALTGPGTGLFSETTGLGTGGAISLQANQVQLTNGATISAKTTGAGNAGNVTIEGLASPAQSVLIDGLDSGIFTNTQGTGAGGNIFLNTNSVTLQNGGTLSAATSGNASLATGGAITVEANQVQVNSGGLITTQSTGQGNAGAIVVNADSSFQSSGGTVSTTAAQAQGGNLNITAGQSVNLSDSASISASSAGTGNAGNISINAGNQLMMQSNSSITTQASHASGGNIDIRALDQVRMVNSKISTSVLGGAGSGGNITIDPNTVVLQNSQILAQAVNGAGGNITITTPLFLADSTSLVSASSQFGLNGTVTIQSPTSNLSGTVASLPSSMRQQQVLQAQRCAALSGGESSTFTIAGRDTIPTEPGGWLASLLGLHNLDRGLVAETTSAEQRPTMLAMAQTTEPISLRRLTPAGFLTQHFAGNGSDGCRS